MGVTPFICDQTPVYTRQLEIVFCIHADFIFNVPPIFGFVNCFMGGFQDIGRSMVGLSSFQVKGAGDVCLSFGACTERYEKLAFW